MTPTAEETLATRWSLIRKVTAPDCDEDNWGEFYALYEHLIQTVARRMGLTHQEAQDAMQDTMRSVCEALPQFRADPAHGSFRSWLLQIARWRIGDILRRRPLRAEPAGDDDGVSCRTSTVERLPDPAGPDFEALWEDQWKASLFARATERVKQRVSPEQFQIFDF